MKVNINPLLNYFFVTVETKNGRRYHTTYTVKPTSKEVIEDFKESRANFQHTN